MLGEIDPEKDADGLHPTNLGWLVLGKPAPLPCTPFGIVDAAAPSRRGDQRRRRRGRRSRRDRRPAARPAADPPVRERHGHAVPHRHPRPRRARAPGRHRGGRGRRARASSPATWSSPAPPYSTSASPGWTGKLAGDVDPSVYDVAAWVSPNPGGVGPMTRAMLLSNVVERGRGRTPARRRGEPQLVSLPQEPRRVPVHPRRDGLPDRRGGHCGRPADRRVRPLASRRHPDRAGRCSSAR